METNPWATMLADPGMSPEDHAINNGDAQRVQALLTRLPERQCAIVELRLAGLSGAEIDPHGSGFRCFSWASVHGGSYDGVTICGKILSY
jgi:hypothetical protein